ncbi:MAG: hypothetical protein J6N77_03675 [Lachnospiraceae bacterium]|nr:hypothetical protein [Lachnospiraceae bacterium]
MAITQMRCSNCTAPISIEPKRGRNVVCQYCGATFTVDAQTWKNVMAAEKDMAAFEAEKQREERDRAAYMETARQEEKNWKGWMLQWRILLIANAVLTMLNFSVPDSSPMSGTINMFWGVIFLGSTIYLAIRRPEMTVFKPKSTFAKGGKSLCYLKITGIKWAVAIIATMVADLI